MVNLTNEIKAYRNRKGFTQAEVAQELSVSLATYVNYENNPFSMSVSTLIRLCDIIDEKLATIFFTEELYEMYREELNKKENNA